MDRISDSGSEGCGSIPHGGTRTLEYRNEPETVGVVLVPEAILVVWY